MPNQYISQNTDVYSLLLEGKFQIDINVIDSQFFDTAEKYLDYSPIGNSLGKCYHKFGLSYGYDGLSYILRDNFNTYKLGKIQLSLNNKKIYEFLGLDYNKRIKGFNTECGIFDYVISSPYFNADSFSFENMNHISRIRDRKRPDYNRLLNYINENHKDKNYYFLPKEEYLPIIDAYFPESNLLSEIQKLKNKALTRKKNAEKFNGFLVREWIEVSGKELGMLIQGFKKAVVHGESTFEDYLTILTPETVKSHFLNWFYSNNH